MASHQHLMSLRRCASELRRSERLGTGAPAYITLKRWSAAGRLASAVKPGTGTRPLYALDEVLRISRSAHEGRHASAANDDAMPGEKSVPPANAPHHDDANGNRVSDAPEPRLTASQDPAVAPLLAQIASVLADVRSSNSSRLQAIENGLSNLEATRRMLMMKYDAEAHALKARVAELERENAALRGATTVVEVSKLNVLLSRVAERLERQT